MPPKKRSRDDEDEDDTECGSWTKHESVLLLPAHPPALKGTKVKVAAFDMDDTLVCAKDGRTFPKDRKDWVWLHPSVPEKLKSVHQAGYCVVIISNQAGLEGKDAKASGVQGKVLDLSAEVGVPISAALATEKDEYRKPEPRLWELVQEKLLHGAEVDYGHSYYVGDAAGRTILTMAKRKKDFSCGDRKFAHNCGLKFYTPEEYYLGAAAEKAFHWDGPGPDDLKSLPKSLPNKTYHSPNQELVVMMGFPGSGKSTFYRRYLKDQGYAWANQDTLKTKDKVIKFVKESLAAGKSVCVDATNPQKDSRAPFLKMAKEAKVPVRCFRLTHDEALAEHQNAVRMRLGGPRVSSIAYKMFSSKLEEPTLAEGFAEILKIEPTADFTAQADVEKVFYLLS